jgi:hypothetical protein
MPLNSSPSYVLLSEPSPVRPLGPPTGRPQHAAGAVAVYVCAAGSSLTPAKRRGTAPADTARLRRMRPEVYQPAFAVGTHVGRLPSARPPGIAAGSTAGFRTTDQQFQEVAWAGLRDLEAIDAYLRGAWLAN